MLGVLDAASSSSPRSRACSRRRGADARPPAAAGADAAVLQQGRRAALDDGARAPPGPRRSSASAIVLARLSRAVPGRATPARRGRGSRSGLADHDDALLAAYVDDAMARPRRAAARRARRDRLGRGARAPGLLRVGVRDRRRRRRADGRDRSSCPPAAAGDLGRAGAGTVFKVERGPAGEKVAFVLHDARARWRDARPAGAARGAARDKVTAISVFDRRPCCWPRDAVAVGPDRQAVGPRRRADRRPGRRGVDGRREQRPVRPAVAGDGGRPRGPRGPVALHVALGQLAEQDPLIDVRQDDGRREVAVSLYGEVQKEVLGACSRRLRRSRDVPRVDADLRRAARPAPGRTTS